MTTLPFDELQRERWEDDGGPARRGEQDDFQL